MTINDKRQPVTETELLSAAKSTLERNVDQIDEQTRSRLYAARRQAIDAFNSKQPGTHRTTRWVFPIAGLATVGAALLVAVTLWTLQPAKQFDGENTPVAVLEDLNLLTGSEEIDFYQDLDFYEWLAVNEQDVS